MKIKKNIKNKELLNNQKKNEQEKKENLPQARPKSRAHQKANIHTIFSIQGNIKNEETNINNIKLINLNKPKIMREINTNNVFNSYKICFKK